MAFMTRIGPTPTQGDRTAVRLLRLYATCRGNDEQVLPSMIALGARLWVPAPAVVALASVFQITEACLGRTLVTARSCSRELGSDEEALLLLLRHAPHVGTVHTSRAVPHGLPGVLLWAVESARRLCGEPDGEDPTSRSGGTCPFARSPARQSAR